VTLTRIVFILGALIVGCAAAASIAVLSGFDTAVADRGLSARVAVTDFPLPTGFGIAPEAVVEYLSTTMMARSETDIALRIALGTDGLARLGEVAIPRLLNAGVIRTMVRDVPQLADTFRLAELRAVAPIIIRNNTATAISDVAMTLPGALRAQTTDGAPIKVSETAAQIPALDLGEIGPGDGREVTVWLDRDLSTPPPSEAALWIGLREGAALAGPGVTGQLRIAAVTTVLPPTSAIYHGCGAPSPFSCFSCSLLRALPSLSRSARFGPCHRLRP